MDGFGGGGEEGCDVIGGAPAFGSGVPEDGSPVRPVVVFPMMLCECGLWLPPCEEGGDVVP